MLFAIPVPHGGGPGMIGLILALGVCVLLGRFVWQSFNEPVSTAQRVIAAGLLVFFFGGILVIAVANA